MQRAFIVLETLKVAGEPLSALQVARRTGLERTVVHRLLNTLVLEEMVTGSDGSFQLGPGSVLLADAYVDGLQVRRVAMPYLLDLQSTVIGSRPWTVNLSVAIGDVTTVVERIWTASAPLLTVLEVGNTIPIDLGAAGRSILAYRPTQEVRALVGARRYKAVRPVLDHVRAADGVALTDGEAYRGVQALACAVLIRREEPIATVAVSGLDLGEELAYESTLATAIQRTARAIGRALA